MLSKSFQYILNQNHLPERLTEIKFDNCNLGDVECIGIAEEFQLNNNLTSLSLRNNQISTDGFHELCKELVRNKCKLKHLDLQQNFINDDSATDFGKLLTH